jgi:hypothetical protein
MSSVGAAPGAVASLSLSPARAAASRSNGAKSRGPKTPEGRARAAQNALKHGLRAQKCVVLPGERASAFAAFEAALIEELAPEGALQTVLAQRVVAASWRLARSERIEAELFAEQWLAGASLGLALTRDGNGARAFDTLLRYRGAAQAEFSRTLRLLKTLQAEAAQPQSHTRPREAAPEHAPPAPRPNQPEARSIPGESRAEAASAVTPPRPDPATPCADSAPAVDPPADPAPDACTDPRGCTALVSTEPPIEPENRRKPGESQATAAGRTVSRTILLNGKRTAAAAR